jgi:hypothetical protein
MSGHTQTSEASQDARRRERTVQSADPAIVTIIESQDIVRFRHGGRLEPAGAPFAFRTGYGRLNPHHRPRLSVRKRAKTRRLTDELRRSGPAV